jgi:hypothetical protein
MVPPPMGAKFQSFTEGKGRSNGRKEEEEKEV